MPPKGKKRSAEEEEILRLEEEARLKEEQEQEARKRKQEEVRFLPENIFFAKVDGPENIFCKSGRARKHFLQKWTCQKTFFCKSGGARKHFFAKVDGPENFGRLWLVEPDKNKTKKTKVDEPLIFLARPLYRNWLNKLDRFLDGSKLLYKILPHKYFFSNDELHIILKYRNLQICEHSSFCQLLNTNMFNGTFNIVFLIDITVAKYD